MNGYSAMQMHEVLFQNTTNLNKRRIRNTFGDARFIQEKKERTLNLCIQSNSKPRVESCKISLYTVVTRALI